MKKGLVAMLFLACAALLAGNVVVYIGEDRKGPEILVPQEEITYVAGTDTSALLNGVTAQDNRDGDVTDTVTIESIIPNADQTGASVIYVAKDSKNNVTKETRTIVYSTDANQAAAQAAAEQAAADQAAQDQAAAEQAAQGDAAGERAQTTDDGAAQNEAAIAALSAESPRFYLTQYSDARALREGEYEDMSSAYVNMMDLRFDESYVRGETWSWFNDAYDLMLEFLREGCYRVYPYQVTVPVKMVNGQEYTIDHGWKNRGKAYCPTNIPQYQDRFKVAFALLNTETGEIVGDNIFFDETADPSEWTEDGGPVGYSLKVTPENVPAGYYNIGVAIIDMFAGDPATGDYRPGIQLSAQNETTATGWLKVKKIAVTDK